jgi:hypothetical protein
VDTFTQQRVLQLRNEIAFLRRENAQFRSQKNHTVEQWQLDQSRLSRLLEIREELGNLANLNRPKNSRHKI